MREAWERCPQCRVLGGPLCPYCSRPYVDNPFPRPAPRPAPASAVAVEPAKPRPNLIKIHNFIMSRDNDATSKLRVLDEAIEIASGDDLEWLGREWRSRHRQSAPDQRQWRCEVCRLEAVGTPVPGYPHDDGCHVGAVRSETA